MAVASANPRIEHGSLHNLRPPPRCLPHPSSSSSGVLSTLTMYHVHRYVDDWPQLGDWPLEHDVHCFDSLRQHVMCHADDTLLYSTGHHDAGVQQTKMCRSWDALRDWASGQNAQWKDHINPRSEGDI
ncbi:hypothetical protein VP1G_02846 [Cytospora mali]|uniref:Uncharacterized protein n=1 Tax=Cytospora mali TaxID=578113 RepID=A0A194UUY1_CYTMA|nr:hypothetical protein VP1G_02846 [Valsa mali var. pyri (nom. inval.)]